MKRLAQHALLVCVVSYCLLSVLHFSSLLSSLVLRSLFLNTPLSGSLSFSYSFLPATSRSRSRSVPESGLLKHLNISSESPGFIQKAFLSTSMHGSGPGGGRIIPYFYRAQGEIAEEDITITTLVTSNRFGVFERLVRGYEGPISATLHIPSSPPSTRDALLSSLHELYTSNPSMLARVDIHLILDPYERQFNLWRNVARFYARTEWVMMLDVDFAVCTDFRRRVLGNEEVLGRMRGAGGGNGGPGMALVVPAFEFVRQRDGINASTFPRDKQALLSLVKESKIDMFHKSFSPGHAPTDYPRYYSSPAGQIYRVSSEAYQYAYEPYVIFKREGPPACDGRFVGYGGNKASCLFEMYLAGVGFFVLVDDFLIHQSHTYAEEVRKQERKYNAKVYAAFREETCLKYLARYLLDGSLDTPKGHNVQAECQRIQGVGRGASQLLGSLAEWKGGAGGLG